MSKLNTRRYTNGVKWLEAHGFAAQDDEPCYSWARDGVEVFFDEDGSQWCATFNAWMVEDCITPKAAIGSLRETFELERHSLLKQAQACFEAAERLGKVLEKEENG